MGEENNLRFIFWEITAACNLRCQHCRGEKKERIAAKELTLPEIKAVTEEILTFSHPVVVLTGGEPLLREDIFEIARHISSKKIEVWLATNGTLLNKEAVEKIKGAGISRVSISLDGKDSITHDSLRGFKGAFTQAVKGIAYLRGAGVPFQINTTISRQNYDQIQDIIGLSQHWGAQSLHLFFVIPIGCAKDIFCQQEITAQEYEKVLNYVTEYSQKNSFYIRPICAPFYFGGFKKERVSSHAADKGCLAARQMLFISSQGKVFPCGYLPLSAGDLREDSLESVWRKGEIFVTLRKQNPKGKCASCRFQADCGGGCRARAYALSQDYLAEDPLCIYSGA